MLIPLMIKFASLPEEVDILVIDNETVDWFHSLTKIAAILTFYEVVRLLVFLCDRNRPFLQILMVCPS